MHKISEQRNIQYNLRSQTDFQLRSVKRVNCGVRAFRYLGPNIWNIVSLEIKNSEVLGSLRIVLVIYANLISTVQDIYAFINF